MDHLLKHSSDRFFMMVEGGSIDHAAHSNDGASVIKEIISFDQALRHAYDFYLAHPDETAIIVTSDHDTGGMATVSNGGSLETVDMQKMSKDRLNDRIKSRIASGQRISWDEMADLLTEQFEIEPHRVAVRRVDTVIDDFQVVDFVRNQPVEFLVIGLTGEFEGASHSPESIVSPQNEMEALLRLDVPVKLNGCIAGGILHRTPEFLIERLLVVQAGREPESERIVPLRDESYIQTGRYQELLIEVTVGETQTSVEREITGAGVKAI